VCTDKGLFQSHDSALTWSAVASNGLPPNPAGGVNTDCNHLVLHAPSRTLYMTLNTKLAAPDSTNWIDVDSWSGGLYKSEQFGPAWSPALTGNQWTSANGSADPNLLPNPGFETAGDATHPAAGWLGDASTTVRVCGGNNPRHTGPCSIRLGTTAQAGGGVLTGSLQVQGGEVYRFSGWAKLDYPSSQCPNPGGAGLISFMSRVFFIDQNQNPVDWPGHPGQNFSNPWADGTAPSYSSQHGGWRKFETLVRMPERVASVQFNVYSASNPGCGGYTWIDDVTMQRVQSLPRLGGYGAQPYFSNYDDVVVDPLNLTQNTIYVGTMIYTGQSFESFAETSGLFKSTDGGATWKHVTRGWYKDNVLDGVLSAPVCGNHLCEGRWEKCDTCPEDCDTPDHPWCCGNGVPESNLPDWNECANTVDRCLVDCPEYPDPSRPYYEVNYQGYGVMSLAIGSGTAGHNTLYFGTEHYVTTDAGEHWQETSSDLVTSSNPPFGSWKARGNTNDVDALNVATDARVPERIYYGDIDNFLRISYDGGLSFITEGIAGWGAMTQPVFGDAATSVLMDPVDPDVIYVGISAGLWEQDSVYGGVARGQRNPQTGRWAWTPLGNQTDSLKGGGVDLVRHTDGKYYAAVYTKGVFRLDGQNWTPVSNGLPSYQSSRYKTYRLVSEPLSNRLYVTVDPTTGLSGQSGVWQGSYDAFGVLSWQRITPLDLDHMPVLDILPVGSNVLFASFYTYDDVGASYPNAGLYKALFDSGTNSWSWTRVLAERRVSSVAMQPGTGVLVAFAAQLCCWGYDSTQNAGIYKSVDGGTNWTLQGNDGLMHLGFGWLEFSVADPALLFAATFGSGLFEGVVPVPGGGEGGCHGQICSQ
jgi:hypothetical protein